MGNVLEEAYVPVLRGSGFVPEPESRRYGPNGLCWRLEGEHGEGHYWTYCQKDLFDIKIHDFWFYRDSLLTFEFPECLSVTYYQSFSGEELAPYRRVEGGCVKTFLGGGKPYQVLVHKEVPVVGIGIEVTPAYYESWMKRQYPEEYVHPLEAFRAVDQTDHFPQMVRLLEQVRDYRGEGIAARLFYEAKVAEAVAMVVERGLARPPRERPLSDGDRRQIGLVTDYIDANLGGELTQERLARVACMGTTKLKTAFRQYHGCTITDYIRRRRMDRAERLLAQTDLPIGQVARSVGCRSASRFAGLFRESTGLLPGEYRRRRQGTE